MLGERPGSSICESHRRCPVQRDCAKSEHLRLADRRASSDLLSASAPVRVLAAAPLGPQTAHQVERHTPGESSHRPRTHSQNSCRIPPYSSANSESDSWGLRQPPRACCAHANARAMRERAACVYVGTQVEQSRSGVRFVDVPCSAWSSRCQRMSMSSRFPIARRNRPMTDGSPP